MRFVGRGRELSLLRNEADVARSGRCRVVLIGGEAGVGKTRLVDEFTSGLGSEFRHARASCAGGPDMTALWPWRQLLTALGRELPSSTSTMGDAGFAVRTRYADEVVAAGAAVPHVLVLDDLHRADEASQALLVHLADAAPASAVLVIGLHRDDQALILPAGPAVTRIALHGLSAEDVGELARDLLGTGLPTAVAAQLCRRTDGNPRLIADVIEQIDPEAAAAAAAGERLEITWPEDARSAVEYRLAPLGAESRRTLAWAAVIGREFDVDILERLMSGARTGPTSPSDTDVVDALDEAVRRRMIVARTGQVYAFVRSLDREMLYESFPARERARLHEATADALIEFSSYVGERGPTIAELAYHLVNAAVLGGQERLDRAIAYAVAAGAAATEQGRPYEAMAHQTAALRLAVRARWSPSTMGRLLVGVGLARLACGEVASGREALTAAARLGRQAGDAGLLAAAALGHGPPPGAAETAPPADAALVALLTDALAGELDSSTTARLRARLSLELMTSHGRRPPEIGPGSTEDAERHAEAAVGAARSSGDPRALAEACLAQAAIVRTTDVRVAVREAVALGDSTLECRAHVAAAERALAIGDIGTAERELGAVAGLGGHPFPRWFAAVASAHRALLAGRALEARELAGAAVAAGRRVAPDAAELTHVTQLAAIHVAEGSTADLARVLAALTHTTASPPWLAALSALVAVDRREHDVAMTLVAEVLESHDGRSLWTSAVLGQAAAGLGDTSAAARLVADLTPYQSGWLVIGPAVANGGPVGLALSRLHLVLGDLSAAESSLAHAATSVGSTVWLPHLRLARAQLLAVRGRASDHDDALREAQAARAGAVDRGLPGLIDRVDALLGELAAHTGTGLTRREQEVAALAARGASAREIADQLVIGERTVETHLANIYRKLNVRSRVELMARFAGSPSFGDALPAVED